ncbi:MAG: DASH family cryptochrome [Halieaceae bacterium]|jgi:deoxyribodipyrimidine photo-lyase|nr:DASH family cryptochrome [Halieaceae bacterium]
MLKPLSRHLYLFRNDLRLADNPGLAAHAAGDALLCVFCWPNAPAWCNTTGMGEQRERFLRETVQALHEALSARGQGLLVLHRDPRTAIPRLVELFGIECVGTSRAPGVYETQQLSELQQQLSVPLVVHENASLYTESQLPGDLDALPKQFTPFRRKVENLQVNAPLPEPDKLPPPPPNAGFRPLPAASTRPHPAFPVRGGSAEGWRRLRTWMMDRGLVHDYKQTRNYLDGLDGSSVLSPWLATGALSPREAAHALFDVEARDGRNESTAHLFMELLWREFFHWRALADGGKLFSLRGLRGKKVLKYFEARDFARWSQGHTDSPLVNALMHQLVATGWMTNRGRQIAASYLVNELNHDWRYGAAFFEKHLIDYDVGSNYGNWQYIAGVGTDPRGGRHFNIDKQAAQYDPDGHFTTKWDGYRDAQPRYVTDAADWPLDTWQ